MTDAILSPRQQIDQLYLEFERCLDSVSRHAVPGDGIRITVAIFPRKIGEKTSPFSMKVDFGLPPSQPDAAQWCAELRKSRMPKPGAQDERPRKRTARKAARRGSARKIRSKV